MAEEWYASNWKNRKHIVLTSASHVLALQTVYVSNAIRGIATTVLISVTKKKNVYLLFLLFSFGQVEPQHRFLDLLLGFIDVIALCFCWNVFKKASAFQL